MAARPWRIDRAPAKVNLGLRIVGRRDDGYHLLDSLVVFARHSDHVAARPAIKTEGDLRLTGPFAQDLAGEPDNLVLAAARAFQRRFGGPSLEIVLWKRLPVASGVGGGSADAAAVLRLAAGFAGVAEDDPALAALALDLGADVPMCLAGRAVRVGGIGEELGEAPQMPPLPAILCNPNVPVATPAVFKARVGPFSDAAVVADGYDDVAEIAKLLADFGNDLTTPALSVAPEIADVLAALGRQEGALFAGMSGSGATCFALFDTDAAAAAAAGRMRAARPDWRTMATRLNG